MGGIKPLAVSNDNRVVYGALVSAHDEDEAKLNNDEGFAFCTVFETTCNLASILTGSGVLSLPYAFAETGWAGLILLTVLCAIFMYCFELVAKSTEAVYERENMHHPVHIRHYNIDYISFAKIRFGQYGVKIILMVFGTELTLALVSFLMNIGINLNLILPNLLSINSGIILAACITCVLSLTNLKTAAYSSVVGLVLTLLTLVAIVVSGSQLNANASIAAERHFQLFNLSGMPVSLGLIAFCFGGHGTL